MQVDHIVARILEATGWTQSKLGQTLGVGQGTVSKWFAGSHTPNKAQWDKVLALIMKDPRLADLRPSGGVAHSAPVMGKIGAGAVIDPDFDQASSEGLYDVTLPFPIAADVIALEVEGQSMLPKYEAGDVIVVRRHQEKATSWYIGQLVAIRTEDGRRYLKKLFPGSVDGLYRLESLNMDPIHNVSIQWVGEIFAAVPASQVSRPAAEKEPKKPTAKRRQI